jgi:hypothetical protein
MRSASSGTMSSRACTKTSNLFLGFQRSLTDHYRGTGACYPFRNIPPCSEAWYIVRGFLSGRFCQYGAGQQGGQSPSPDLHSLPRTGQRTCSHEIKFLIGSPGCDDHTLQGDFTKGREGPVSFSMQRIPIPLDEIVKQVLTRTTRLYPGGAGKPDRFRRWVLRCGRKIHLYEVSAFLCREHPVFRSG